MISDTDAQAIEEDEERALSEAAPLPQSYSDINDAFVSDTQEDTQSSAVPLWLITFTDVMALMLTFFVLLYAMSEPQVEKWQQLSISLGASPNQFDGKAFEAASQDVVSIDKISTRRALDLGYLESVIEKLLIQEKIQNVTLIRNQERLIISLPSELLFESGRADMQSQGKALLFPLAGVLARVKNKLVVVGHADPSPIRGANAQYNNNWELSLARSVSVAQELTDLGYLRTIVTRGVSSARYDEISGDVPQSDRYTISRRVDIMVMNNDGYRYDIR